MYYSTQRSFAFCLHVGRTGRPSNACSCKQVDGADAVDVPRVVWIHPDDCGSKPGSIDITTDDWLKKPIRLNFLCPISMKPGR